jgi:murein DD-endopeptidase MepM/ murein hydrolase activator NlpD
MSKASPTAPSRYLAVQETGLRTATLLKLIYGNGAATARSRRLPWFATGLGLPLLSMGFVTPVTGYQEGLRLDQALATVGPAFTLPLLNPAEAISRGAFGNPDAGLGTTEQAVTLEIRRGDTLDQLFRRLGLDLSDLAEVMRLGPAKEYLRLLKPGDQVQVRHEDGSILGIRRQIDLFNTLEIGRENDGFQAQVIALDYETRTTETSGTITSSLFEAAAEAGISDATILKLESIFASDIDFVLDLRDGDEFTLLYEEHWRDGSPLVEGEILAAEFVNQGTRHRAIRYQSPDGRVNYYSPEGKNLRKAFVRAPLAFTRVSSNFNPRRRHPILNTIRAHQGVDYAAPSGTPVRAPGDGKVVFRGRKGGYGNAVILQHPGGITTLYGHLSGFAKSARFGQRVVQGQVIGYVGATGLATAPHLHYEYRKEGVHLNPRTVKLPDATPLDASARPAFQRAAAPLLQRLDARRELLAARAARQTNS